VSEVKITVFEKGLELEFELLANICVYIKQHTLLVVTFSDAKFLLFLEIANPISAAVGSRGLPCVPSQVSFENLCVD
jgi:hypothetical protein